MPAEKTMASTCPPSWTRKAPKYLLSRCKYTCTIQMTVQMSIKACSTMVGWTLAYNSHTLDCLQSP